MCITYYRTPGYWVIYQQDNDKDWMFIRQQGIADWFLFQSSRTAGAHHLSCRIVMTNHKLTPNMSELENNKLSIFVSGKFRVIAKYYSLHLQRQLTSGDATMLGHGGMPAAHDQEVKEVALSDDGKYLASASVDRTVKVWNMDSESLMHTLHSHNDEVRYTDDFYHELIT